MTAVRLAAVVTVLCLAGALPGAASPLIGFGIAGTSGTFQAYQQDAVAVTYEQTKVPVGASVSTVTLQSGHGTVVLLGPRGLLPSHEYGAHVHTKPCGANANDAGPHYQNVPDPHQPSTDPAYANHYNEIWLDFTTDAQGSGMAMAAVDWKFAGTPSKRSVVIHEHHTHDDGTAGARLACMTAAF